MEPNRRNRNNYIDGSTVRKLETTPRRRRKPDERTNSRPRQSDRQKEKQRQINQNIAKRNREKAAKLNLGYTLFLGVAVIVTLITCIFYLNLNNIATQKSSEITLLKQELNTITDANVATAERINSAIDLETVLEQAKALGMNYPDASQIVYYNGTDNEDYVRQYQGIPK